MSWRRLPACLPNLPIRLVPLTESAQKAYEATGFVKQLVFKTVPSVGKVSLEEERDGGAWGGEREREESAARLRPRPSTFASFFFFSSPRPLLA